MRGGLWPTPLRTFPSKIDPIEVYENVAGSIGDPIAATDDDNDVLLYSIVADPA